MKKYIPGIILVALIGGYYCYQYWMFYPEIALQEAVRRHKPTAADVNKLSNKKSTTYTVERVIDCDTLKLTNGNEVKLIGVQCPEDEKMGKKAKDFLEFYLMSKGRNFDDKYRLEFDVQKRDKYGRLLAYVFMLRPGGESGLVENYDRRLTKVNENNANDFFINAYIMKRGFAQPMTVPPNVKYAKVFEELYKEANENGDGLWKLKREGDSCKTGVQCVWLDCSMYDAYDKDGVRLFKKACVNKVCKCLKL